MRKSRTSRLSTSGRSNPARSKKAKIAAGAFGVRLFLRQAAAFAPSLCLGVAVFLSPLKRGAGFKENESPLRRSAKGNQRRRAKANYPIPIGRRAPQAELSGFPPAQGQKKEAGKPVFPQKKPPRRSAPTVPRTPPHRMPPRSVAFCCTPPRRSAPTVPRTPPHRMPPRSVAFCCTPPLLRYTPPRSALLLRAPPKAYGGRLRRPERYERKREAAKKNGRSESEKKRRRMKRRGVPQTPLRFCEIKFPEMPPPPIPPGK